MTGEGDAFLAFKPYFVEAVNLAFGIVGDDIVVQLVFIHQHGEG